MASQTPNVFTYPRQEPGTLGHLDLVEPLRTIPRDVREAIKGLYEPQLTWQPAEGEWCIKEHVGHLATAAELHHKRLYMMSTQTDPILQPQPDAGAAASYASRPIEELVESLQHWRGETVQLLTTLVNWNWARTGRHLVTGRVSIRQMVERMIEHEQSHVARIRELAAAAPR